MHYDNKQQRQSHTHHDVHECVFMIYSSVFRVNAERIENEENEWKIPLS